MKSIIKNKRSLPSGKQGGFLQLIIIIIVAFLLLRYFDITVAQILGYISQAIDWLKGLVS